MTPPKWTIRALAVAAGVLAAAAGAPRAEAQPKPKPQAPVVAPPQVGGWGPNGFVPFYNNTGNLFFPPGLDPRSPNPYLYTPFNQNPIILNNLFPTPPFNPNPFANPFNPIANPFANPFLNPLGPNAALNPWANPFAPAFTGAGLGGSVVSVTTPFAVQQPGAFVGRGPNLAVNPWSGTVVRPLSGVAQTADGSVFFRLPNSEVLAPGSGLYFSPQYGTYLNPSTGVISRPGSTAVFLPWRP
jgi:hypothetical protein